MKPNHDPQLVLTSAPDPAADDALLADLVAAERDIFALAQRHGLQLEALAAWSDRPGVRKTVHRLCRLADLQCQAMLSRYRLVAASRLIAQASAADGELPPEQVRKACVDLLKAQLADLDPPSDDADASEDSALALLKQALADAETQEPQ